MMMVSSWREAEPRSTCSGWCPRLPQREMPGIWSAEGMHSVATANNTSLFVPPVCSGD